MKEEIEKIIEYAENEIAASTAFTQATKNVGEDAYHDGRVNGLIEMVEKLQEFLSKNFY